MAALARILAAFLLAALAIVDFRERRVPRSGQLALLLMAVVDALFIVGGPRGDEALFGALLAGAAGYLVYRGGLIYGQWRRVNVVVFGMGDVRVLALGGALLGLAAVPAFLWRSALFGCVLALGVLLARMLRGQPIDRSLTLPYIPPIALAAGSLLFGMG